MMTTLTSAVFIYVKDPEFEALDREWHLRFLPFKVQIKPDQTR